MRLIKAAHSVYRTQHHMAWVTRYRRKILNKAIAGYLETKLQEARKYYPDWEYIAIAIDVDHVHLHMVIPPKYAVSTVAETLKKNTSRELSKKFRFLKQVYWDNEGIWSKGFFVSTVGINEGIIRKYVQMQEKEGILYFKNNPVKMGNMITFTTDLYSIQGVIIGLESG